MVGASANTGVNMLNEDKIKKIIEKDFTEVPAREFQLFFKNYPEQTYPKLEYSYGVNLGYCQCYSHSNSKNEIVGIFEHWNNCELHSRYFIRTSLKEYINDKENFGKYNINNQWQFDLEWQFWCCPKCDFRYYAEPLSYPPNECPKCHMKLSSDKYKGAFIDSNLDNYSHDELCDAIILLRYQRDKHRQTLKKLTGCPYFGDDTHHKECKECINKGDKKFEDCWSISLK